MERGKKRPSHALIFSFSQPPRVFPIKCAVKAPLQEASAGEREAVSLFEKGNYLVVDN